MMNAEKVRNYVLLPFAVALLVAAFVWSSLQSAGARCESMHVTVEKGQTPTFVTEQFVDGEIRKHDLSPVGSLMKDVDLNRIEQFFSQADYVESVECYSRDNNSVQLDIVPVQPVMRVFDGDESYYMNRVGKRVHPNPGYFTDVPVVYGNFGNDFNPGRLLPMLEYVERDTLLRDLVSMVWVRDSNNVFIVPSIAGHVVNMGSPDGYVSKFAKLLRMYREVLPVKGWDMYDTITLKWDHQVVAAKRRGRSRLEVAAYDPETEESAPDAATIAGSDGWLKQQKQE